MKSNKGSWVVCLSCGHQYYLEHHDYNMNSYCSQCGSRSYKLANEEDKWGDRKVKEELKYMLHSNY